MRRERLIYLGLALVTLLLYGRVVFCDFINYDDPEYVTENAHVQQGVSAEGFVWAFTTQHTGNWHPGSWLSHMLDWQLFGGWPGGHHLTGLLLHVANTLLLFRLLKRMTGSLGRSALVAALFAWHPLHVESVAWVAERKDVLSTLFFLLTVDAYARWVQSSGPAGALPAQSPKRLPWRIPGLFGLGLLCKPMLVTLPVVLLLLDFWPLQRVTPDTFAGWRNAFQRGWRLVWEKASLVLLAALSCGVTLVVQQRGGSVSSLESVSLSARLANALMGYIAYLAKLFWPQDLAVIYPMRTHWAIGWVVLTAVTLLALTGCALAVAHRRRYALTGWLWFLVTLLPVIGLVQVGLQFIADRYTYIPAVGVFVVVVWGGAELLGNGRRGRAVAAVIAGAMLVGCLAATARQLSCWRDSVRLFSRAVAVTSWNYIAHNNLGHALTTERRLEEARSHFEQALEINPNYAQARRNLAMYYYESGELETALEHCRRALQSKPGDVPALCLLGSIQTKLGDKTAASAAYAEALRLDPNAAPAHFALGLELAERGQTHEAVTHYRAALRGPKSAELHYHLANALLRLGETSEAMRHYRRAIVLKPDFAEAHNNLANVLTQERDLPAAVTHLREAVTLKPDYTEAWHNLATLLVRAGQATEAAAAFEQVLKLQPDNDRAQFELGVLHAGLNQTAAALGHLREALRLKPVAAYQNSLARVLATAADPALRNGGEAVRLAEAACTATQRRDFYYLDTLAAAYAEAGRFDEAIAAQLEAITLVRSAGKPNALRDFEERLTRYRAQQPNRLPDS